MVLITAVIGLAASIYSLGSMDEQREKFFYYPLLQFLLMGINGAFLTGDIFNLYVWFEVMLISSFVLLALGGKREQLEGAIKYVTLNLVSSAIFLAAVGILYGIVGTLNMADIARKIPLVEQKELVTVVSFLFMVAFGIKAAVFPLFFWLPASYHTPPIAVSAIFAGLAHKSWCLCFDKSIHINIYSGYKFYSYSTFSNCRIYNVNRSAWCSFTK